MKKLFLLVAFSAGSQLLASADPQKKIALGENHPLVVKLYKQVEEIEKEIDEAVALVEKGDPASIKKAIAIDSRVEKKIADTERLVHEVVGLKLADVQSAQELHFASKRIAKAKSGLVKKNAAAKK